MGLLAIALQACSAVRLGYNKSPEIAYWWLDSYLDFDNAQSRDVRASLEQIQAWHRQEELPRIAVLLADAEGLVERDPTAGEVCNLVEAVRPRVGALAERAIPAMARIAPGLTVDQQETLRKKYLKSNAEYRNDWVDLSPRERQEKRFDQVVDRTEMVYGALQAPQRAAIRAAIARSSFDPEVELAERMRRQADVMGTLRTLATNRASPEMAQPVITALIGRAFESPDPAYNRYRRGLLEESCEGIAATQALMTPKQRLHARKKLADYEKDARELAAAGTGAN